MMLERAVAAFGGSRREWEWRDIFGGHGVGGGGGFLLYFMRVFFCCCCFVVVDVDALMLMHVERI